MPPYQDTIKCMRDNAGYFDCKDGYGNIMFSLNDVHIDNAGGTEFVNGGEDSVDQFFGSCNEGLKLTCQVFSKGGSEIGTTLQCKCEIPEVD